MQLEEDTISTVAKLTGLFFHSHRRRCDTQLQMATMVVRASISLP